ncbi:MAG: hypothetical protein H7A55_14695 [Verrucomicrobiaceae bacterium]|nr:hypothetical protein [Verrucomicrobiaceae bacterium]
MKALQITGSIAAMIFTFGSMLAMWIFAAASLANTTSDASYQRVRLWVVGFSAFAVIGISVGIWLLVGKRYALSTSVSLLPAAVMFIALVWQLIRPS